jgi:hypothetical protein
MKTYTLFWRTGITEIVKGNTPEDLLNELDNNTDLSIKL